MSYTLQLWEKPAEWPWPATKAEADAQWQRVLAMSAPGQNPKFLDWGRALHEHYPEAMDVWLDGSEEGFTDEATLGFGINTHSPHWDDAFEHAWVQAGLRGLNLYDPQSGVHYLGNGDVPEEPALQVQRAVRARAAGDDAAAWAEYRRLAALGNLPAIYAMGHALRFGGMGQRRHFDLAALLQMQGAHDVESRQEAQAYYQKFSESQQPALQRIRARIQAGTPLLEVVDSERRAVDEAFQRTERLMLETRRRVEASGGLEAAAMLGHEVAAFQRALEAVIGWDEPDFDNARYWCERAVDWDHEPAKRLFALMHEHGWGGPVDGARAAQWNQAAMEQRHAQRADAAALGGLRLVPAEVTPPAAAPVSGFMLRDVVGWFAREGNPHAAFFMGTLDEHGREGGPADDAKARGWYAQAADAGHADGTYNLATFVEVGAGGTRDVLAAKALYMLAHARGSTVRNDDLRIAPGEQAALREWAVALREPGRLRAVLQQRGVVTAGRGPFPAPEGAAPARSLPDERRAGPALALPGGGLNTEDDEDEHREDRDLGRTHAQRRAAMSLHLGHLALLVGAFNLVLLIAFARPGASFRLGMFLLGLMAAWGAWRTGRDMGWSPAVRALAAVAVAVPVAGMAASAWMLLKAFRSRD